MSIRQTWAMALGLGVGTLGLASEAAAQAGGPTVIPVPFSQINPALPHPAHENARVTLKAIVRNAPCVGGYRVAWDVNLNNNFDDDATRLVTPVGSTLYDIGATFQVPVVAQDTRLPVGVRVRSTCANVPDAFGTFRLFVYDFEPNPDARTWSQTPDQLTIMGQMAIQESLWYSHRASANRAAQGTAGVRSQYGTYSYVINGTGIWLFTNNGHQPAYPPGTINAFNVPLPIGWAAANDARWNTDPYAETVMSFVNGALNNGTSTVAIAAGAAAAEEANTCGFNANGTERMCNRVPGTSAAAGAYTGGSSNNVYAQGMLLGGMATVLPALAATRLQVGGLAGRTWESFIQDMADYLGYMQFDGGCALGGWLYTAANGAAAYGNSDGSTSQWAYIGLESAEVERFLDDAKPGRGHVGNVAVAEVSGHDDDAGRNVAVAVENLENLRAGDVAQVVVQEQDVGLQLRGQETGLVAVPRDMDVERPVLREVSVQKFEDDQVVVGDEQLRTRREESRIVRHAVFEQEAPEILARDTPILRLGDLVSLEPPGLEPLDHRPDRHLADFGDLARGQNVFHTVRSDLHIPLHRPTMP